MPERTLEERLQRFLARAGVASRRHCEELIRDGKVTVNGKLATLGDKVDPKHDTVKVEGKRIEPQATDVYLLLNKPDGYLTTHSDPKGRPTVFDLIPARWHKGLVAVGRLDFHSEGLLLLTTDGELAQRVSHPRYGGKKTYAVKVRGVPKEEDLDRLRRGIFIDKRRTRPAKIKRRRPPTGGRQGANPWYTVELHEGRSRQIREMFFRIGHPVQKLRRVAIDSLEDASLPLGACRELTATEVDRLKRKAGDSRGSKRRRGPSREGGR